MAGGDDHRRRAGSGVRTLDVEGSGNHTAPRGAAGDLEAGARDVLAKVDAVESIDEMDVTGFRPTANDIRVDLSTRLRVTAPRSAVADALEDGFAILDVTVADEDH